MVTGRNEPCPCGSGKKYKKCCLSRRAFATSFTKEDRVSSFSKLRSYSEELLADEYCAARREFYGPLLERLSELDRQSRESSQAVFDVW